MLIVILLWDGWINSCSGAEGCQGQQFAVLKFRPSRNRALQFIYYSIARDSLRNMVHAVGMCTSSPSLLFYGLWGMLRIESGNDALPL